MLTRPLAALFEGGENAIEFGLTVRVDRLIGFRSRVQNDDTMQRRHCRIDASITDDLWHVSKEQGQQQGADMRAVNIRVGHDDDFAVTSSLEVEASTRTGPDHLDDGCAFDIRQHVADGCLLHVENLAADRQQGLIFTISSKLGCAKRRVTLDDKELAIGHIVGSAVNELRGKRRTLERILAALRLLMSSRRDA